MSGSSHKGKHLKRWHADDMENAINLVKEDNMPVLTAAKQAGVPQSTLHKHLKGTQHIYIYM